LPRGGHEDEVVSRRRRGRDGRSTIDEYEAALDASAVSHATWDVDAQGVPHHLGVLSHFDAVVWELGDNRLTQDPEDEITDTFLFGRCPTWRWRNASSSSRCPSGTT
jgi:hypothetical protein